MNFMKKNIVAAMMSVAVIAAVPMANAQPYTGEEFETAVKNYLESNPEVIIGSINKYVAAQQALEKQAENERFFAVEEAFVNADGLPTLGNPDGAIKIYYVLDASCVYCRQMEPVLEAILENNDDVQVIQRWVPFLTPASEYAARVTFLVKERFADKYYDFYENIMSQTVPLTTEIVDGVLADLIGEEAANIVKIDVADGSEGMRVGGLVERNLEIVNAAGVAGTPFFYVQGLGNEGVFRGAAPLQVMQEAIDKARNIK